MLSGHGYAIHALAYSPDGRWLAFRAGVDGSVRLWEAKTGDQRGARCAVTAVSSTPSPSRRTAGCWPPPAATAPSGCGGRDGLSLRGAGRLEKRGGRRFFQE